MNQIFSNPEAEVSLVATVLADNMAWIDVEFISPEQFEDPHMRIIWSCIKQRGGQISLDNLVTDLVSTINGDSNALDAIGGRTELLALYRVARPLDEIRNLASVIIDCYANRQLRDILSKSINIFKPQDVPISARERIAFLQRKLDHISITPETSSSTFLRGIEKSKLRRSFLQDNPNKMAGLKLGWPDLDKIIYGLNAGNLLIIASNTGEGKSIFVTNIAAYLASHVQDDNKQCKVLYYGLEMSAEEMNNRFISAYAPINSLLLDKTLDKEELKKVSDSQDWVCNKLAPNFVYMEPGDASSLSDIVQTASYYVRHEGIQCIIVDYIQRISTRGREKRNEEIGDITSRLKLLASQLEVPIIAVSQVTRSTAKEHGGKPTLWDLAEGSAIEKDADYVLLLWRPGKHLSTRRSVKTHWQDIAIIEMAKGRFRQSDTCYLLFQGAYSRFVSLDSKTVSVLREREKEDLSIKAKKEDT